MVLISASLQFKDVGELQYCPLFGVVGMYRNVTMLHYACLSALGINSSLCESNDRICSLARARHWRQRVSVPAQSLMYGGAVGRIL